MAIRPMKSLQKARVLASELLVLGDDQRVCVARPRRTAERRAVQPLTVTRSTASATRTSCGSSVPVLLALCSHRGKASVSPRIPTEAEAKLFGNTSIDRLSVAGYPS